VLTDLRIRNFKGWRDTGPVRLAPLTVLFGSNSSGKSSLHQLLLLLRQTVESPDRRRVLHFGDAGTAVDLGSFADLIFRHDTSLPLRFELGWRPPEPVTVADARHGVAHRGDALRFEAEIRAGAGTAGPHVERLGYRLLDDGRPRLALGLERADGGYRLTAEGFAPVPAPGDAPPLSAPAHFHAFPDDVGLRFQNLEGAADLTYALERRLRSITYLGPLRERPERLYRWSGEEPESVGWRGELSVAALLAGDARRFARADGDPPQPLQVVVAEWLRRLDVIEDFEVAPLVAGHDRYLVRVRAPGRAADVLMTDVGFGVSQVLPVVTQAFYADPGQTVIVEQPEIHLHPAVQSRLADLLIDAVRMREDGRPRDVQFIVESHSEHLLRRLLRRIAEEEIGPRDVAMYFATPTPDGSRLEPLDVDELGIVRNWPQDFFGDPIEDVAAQAQRATQRRLSERG